MAETAETTKKSAMDKFIDWLDKYLTPVAEKLGNNRFLRSMADGMVAVMPLTIVGAIFSMVGNLPTILPFLPDYSDEVYNAIVAPYNFLFAMLALIISFSVAYNHAKNYDMNQFNCGMLSLLNFVMITGMQSDGSITTDYFGYSGIFTAVLCAIITVEVYRFMINHSMWIKMPDSVPPSVAGSFQSILPMTVLILFFYLLSLLCQYLTGSMIPDLIQTIVTPAIEGSDSIWYQVILHFFMQLFFWLGMHGWSVLAGIIVPIQTTLLAGNAEAAAAGEALPYFTAGGVNFIGTYLWFLPLMLIFCCKSERNRAVGKIGLVPGIFGIGEPVQFGLPIVLNPILGIPYIIYQPICVAIIHAATKYGLMNRSSVSSISGIPQPFATWIACDGDWRVFFWFAVCTVVCVVIWYPFLKVWDNKCLKEEAEEKAAKEAAAAAANETEVATAEA